MMCYWRYYPRFLQLLLLLLLIFTLASFSAAIAGFFIEPLFHVSLQEVLSINESSSQTVIDATIFLQAISSAFTFLISAFLFSYFTHPQPLGYLGMKKNPPFKIWIWVPIVILLMMPFVNFLGEWMQQFDFGNGLKALHNKNEQLMKTLLHTASISGLLVNIVVFAVLPAIGEEWFFRGIVMRFSFHSSKNIWYAMVMSSAIFALAHGSVYNFLPIFLMGMLLGYLYYITGSIRTSIVAHFINNCLGILGMYLVSIGAVSEEVEHISWYVALGSLIVFIACVIQLKKVGQPLPMNWSDDFKDEPTK
jgi:membrane protease YdiL (CAAX protease family)